MRIYCCCIVCAAVLGLASEGRAEHPVDVERFAAEGDYLQALAAYDRLPQRILTSEAMLAAAKSAWALGLSERAIREIERLLREKDLRADLRTEAHLTRAIIEYQEGRYQVADLYAEKTVRGCAKEGAQRSTAFLLWGESLAAQGAYGAAESKLSAAWEGAAPEQRAEIAFQRAMARVHLGKSDEARADFEQVPQRHERSAEAIRALARISLDEGDFGSAAFWLERGRAWYPQRFLDSWVDYALVQVALFSGDQETVRTTQQSAVKKYPPSDPWLTLLSAAVEAHTWEGRGAP